jgi:galactose oxidase
MFSNMRPLSVRHALIAAALTGLAHAGSGTHGAGHVYLEEASRGERIVSGQAVYDKPSWEPSFRDQAGPYKGFRITREAWDVTCSSHASTCQDAFDGKNDTAWRSEFTNNAEHITIDLNQQYAVSALIVLPPIDLYGEDGLIMHHEVYLSKDAKKWVGPVAYGMWPNTNRQRMSAFEPTSARYVRLIAPYNDPENTPRRVGIAEFNIYANLYTIEQSPKRGVWGPTIDLPVVAAAAAQEATGQVMLWSSWGDDEFHSTPGGKTAMSRWDFRTNKVTKRVVTNTHHDMFCPGISIDGTGNMVVSGGNDAGETSLFIASKDAWESADYMDLERGYQAQTTISDGRVFVIGGSWAGGSNIEKNGEIYDPATRKWSPLPGAKVKPMLTDDMEGAWRADNHGWLFGWKNNTVFQAGPSVAMNWYSVEGKGDVKPAGKRGYESKGKRVDDEDSMSGNAVMFDAVAGKILTFGGSPDYDKSWAHANAHIITLGEPNQLPKVEPAGKIGQMNAERVFHTSVVLPDGTVFIVGGQTFGVAFNEESVQFTPELYVPKTNTFLPMQKHNMARVYHSSSILVPDGRVMTGGGGLCGNCSANHYDAQLFTPPYLLTPYGKERERPQFAADVPGELTVGDKFTFKTKGAISDASLIRISTATHTVNTDQRRVPLDLNHISSGASHGYEVRLPNDAGILIPGYWMMFVMDKDGTPSIAETILIKTNSKKGGRVFDSEQSEVAAEIVDEWQPAEESKYRKQELLV